MVGLHGHPLAANMARVTVAEAVGTFMLMLTIVSTAIGATLARPVAGVPYGSLALPLAGGIVLAIATWLMGDRVIPSSVRHMDGFGSHIYCGGTAQASGTG